MARHAASRRPAQRTLMRAGLTLAAAGAALGAGGAATASAQHLPLGQSAGLPAPLGKLDVQAAGAAVTQSLPYATAPPKNLKIDPLAGTGVDPLDNAVGTQVSDFKPLSTAAVTDPVTKGGTLGTLPVAGQAASLLP